MNSRFEFVLRNFKLYYHFGNVQIDYGGGDSNAQVIVRNHVLDDFFADRRKLDPSKVVWKEWKGVRLPFCFDENDTLEIISVGNHQSIINYDIIASAFYFLSGWDEYADPVRDEFGRVSYEESIIKVLDIAYLPVVNHYFDILYEAIKHSGSISRRVHWGEYSFAVNVTHDVDLCFNGWIEGSKNEFKKGRLFSIPLLLFRRIFGKDDWFNFQHVSNIDRAYGARSTFFFVAKKGKQGKYINSDYEVTSTRLQQAMNNLLADDHEIGVHGSFGTHLDPSRLAEDIQKINKKGVTGNRFHFLLFDVEKTVGVLEDNFLSYDTTLGFAEHIGFRRSFCLPFFLYDFYRERCSSVLEIPLTAMDATLFYPQYMGVSKEGALMQMKLLVTEIKKHHGVFTLLWHNNYFSKYSHTGWSRIYEEMLAYCQKENALLTNGKGICSTITGLDSLKKRL